MREGRDDCGSVSASGRGLGIKWTGLNGSPSLTLSRPNPVVRNVQSFSPLSLFLTIKSIHDKSLMRHSRDNASRSLLLHISELGTVSNPHQYSLVDVQSHNTHHEHRDRRH